MEYSVFTKDYGILTKEMRLENGEIIKDGSQCRMATGSVKTVTGFNLLDLAENLKNLTSNQAIGLGVPVGNERALRIVTKGLEAVGSISRSKEYFHFKEGKPALMLFDYDPEKGKPALSMMTLIPS